MTALLIFIGFLLVIGYFENKKRWKKQDESFNEFLGGLGKMVDDHIEEAQKKLDEIGRENGVD